MNHYEPGPITLKPKKNTLIQHYKAEPVVSINKSGPIVLLTMNQGLQHVNPKYNVDQTLQTGSIKSIPETGPIVSIFKTGPILSAIPARDK